MFDTVPERLVNAVKRIQDRGEKKYILAAGWVAAQYLEKNFGSPDSDLFI